MHQPAVNVMIKAARAGANVLVRSMSKLESLNVEQKERFDFASEADRMAEVAIVSELRRAHPDYAVLGEEGGHSKGNRGPSRFTWVIDPLDGTSNFLRGIPHWCVSIALCEGAEPVHGVVFDPLRNELFTASRGGGAQLNGKKIRIGDRKDLEGSLLVTGFPPRERKRADAQLDCIKSLLVAAEDLRRTGSAALDLAYVASGRVDGYFEAGVKAWDIAAGALLVREAGGKLCDFRGGTLGPLHIDGPTRQVIAANVRLIDGLQKVLVNTGYAKAFD